MIPDNQMMDAGGGGSTYYKVAALDRHGNEGPATSAAAASGAVGVPNGVSPALALHGATPNPSRDGALSVSFTLPGASAARIDVVDLAGRHVATASVGSLGAGPHTIALARGRPLANGMYVIRLVAGDRVLTTKAVVTR